MTVCDARYTRFYLELVEETGPVGKLAAEAVANMRDRDISCRFDRGGQTFVQYKALAPLWCVTADSTVTRVPDELARLLGVGSPWREAHVMLYTNVVALDDARRPMLGEYHDDRKFPGCTATVAIVDSETGRIGVTVNGPFALYGLYFAAILSRKVRPAEWHQPKSAIWV
jgi:hypothetical protein